MQCEVLGFRYATNRWLALVGLSLISFFLVLKNLPLLCTLVVRIYRRKSNNTHNKHASVHDSQPRHASHNSSIEYHKQTCSDI
jgi:hypothetical protein